MHVPKVQPRRFDTTSEEFYLHVLQMRLHERVYLQGRRFYKDDAGGLHLDPCQLPCGFWEGVDLSSAGVPVDQIALSLFPSEEW
jgi:hypothetical protein